MKLDLPEGLGGVLGLSGSCQGAMGSAFSPAKCSAAIPEIN